MKLDTCAYVLIQWIYSVGKYVNMRLSQCIMERRMNAYLDLYLYLVLKLNVYLVLSSRNPDPLLPPRTVSCPETKCMIVPVTYEVLFPCARPGIATAWRRQILTRIQHIVGVQTYVPK